MTATPAVDRLVAGLASRGVDVSEWGREFLLRRLRRGALLSGDVFVDRHVDRILDDAPVLDAFLRDLSVGVSRFFRDPVAFGVLEVLLPSLTRSPAPLTALSLGCAQGQEVWSLAMLLAEQEVPFEVVGVDRHPAFLASAQEGLYTFDDVEEVTLARARRFLVEREGHHLVAPILRPFARFECADITDVDLSCLSRTQKVQLIACRNVLIYLSPVARRQLIDACVEHLAPGGLLMLGSADPRPEHPHIEPVFEAVRMYRRKP